MCCQLHLVSVTKAKVCVGLFTCVAEFKRVEFTIWCLILWRLQQVELTQTQATRSVVHRRDTMSGKKGSMGCEESPGALWKGSPALQPQWMLWWFQCQVCERPATGSWCEQLNMNCCPKLQELKKGGCRSHSQELCCGTWDKAGSFGYPLPGPTSAPGSSYVPTFAFFGKMLLGRALTLTLHTPDFIHKCFCKKYITTLSLCSRLFS